MLTRAATIVASLVLLAGAVACDDDQTKNREETANPVGSEPQAQFGRASPEEQNLKTQKVEIRQDDVRPRQLEIQAAQPIQLEISNSGSSPCTFYLGSYIAGVQVAAGETARQSLTIPQGGSSQSVQMGCAGDDDRRGTAVIEFRGTRPGEGR